jgi:hypothetical protein
VAACASLERAVELEDQLRETGAEYFGAGDRIRATLFRLARAQFATGALVDAEASVARAVASGPSYQRIHRAAAELLREIAEASSEPGQRGRLLDRALEQIDAARAALERMSGPGERGGLGYLLTDHSVLRARATILEQRLADAEAAAALEVTWRELLERSRAVRERRDDERSRELVREAIEALIEAADRRGDDAEVARLRSRLREEVGESDAAVARDRRR